MFGAPFFLTALNIKTRNVSISWKSTGGVCLSLTLAIFDKRSGHVPSLGKHPLYA